MKKNVLFLFMIVFFMECTTVPISGRSRVNLVSDAQVLPVSFAQYQGFIKENKLSKNAGMTQQIKDVGQNVSAAVDRFMRANNMISEANSYQWEFNLVEDKTVNAWCLPGGKVVFYTGILPICENVDGIAAVMGHEVAHAFAKHGQERMTSTYGQQLGAVLVSLGTSKEDPKTQAIWNAAYGISSQVGMLSFSRTHETEADQLGLVFMLMAGYKGTEAAEVWVRMSKQAGSSSTPEFLSTHPSHETRIQTLKNYLPTAKKYADKYNAQAAALLKE